MNRFAAAVSEHPVAAHATGEVVGQVLDGVGESPDVAIVFATGRSGGGVEENLVEEIVETIQSTLRPGLLLGTTAVSVVGNRREVEDTAAIALWAGRFPSFERTRLTASRGEDGWEYAGLPAAATSGTLILLADPFSFPVDSFLEDLHRSSPDLVAVGGMASASTRPGGNKLVLDDAVYEAGAVGVILPAGAVDTLVSQGCRPVGDPFTVTASEQDRLLELGGRRAFDRLRDLLRAADDKTAHDKTAHHNARGLLERGLHLGVVVNEQQHEFRRGDFLIRGVMGVDADSGAITVGDRLEVGQTVQFQVRDATTAHEDLQHLIDSRRAKFAGALLFTCNGRGERFFGVPNHDAGLLHDSLDGPPIAGFFCAGEIGPVGGRNHVHGYSASLALFA